MKENVILVDFEENDEFILDQYLENYSKEKWTTKYYPNNYYKRGLRQLTYFTFPLKIFFHLSQYDKVIGYQQFFGIILAFYCRLFHKKRNDFITIMTFIYNPKEGLLGKLKYKFIKYAVESKYVSQVICYSRNEVEYYSKLFNQKFSYCPLGYKDKSVRFTYSNESPKENGYFLACGRSNRDYEFLLDLFKDLPYKLRNICDELQVESTENVTIYNNVKDDGYYEMLSKCYAVLIPLKDKIISSGQMVFIESMMFSKPIIVTNTIGLKDYLNEDVFTVENTNEEFKEAINKILDKNIYKENASKLKEHYLKEFTQKNMFTSICKLIY